MSLSASEMSTLSRLLDEALPLDEPARRAWLATLADEHRALEPALRRALIASAGQGPDQLLATIPKVAGEEPRRADARLAVDARVGVYRLVRELGQGGMATVWLAHRTDELVQRQVALKLPHVHLHGERFAERFARERDILANLTHPHIARLYDAGVSADGQPYLAMEYVAGRPLVDYAAERGLALEGRLRLFLQVLDAVAHAHAQGVVHRDLKPSNILVREGDQVALLDFGIAKLIVDGQAEQPELTQHGAAILTPHYASPEQVRGEALGPATDVFSLGVVLYELLCERRPWDLAGQTRRELEAAILTAEPSRPSEVLRRRTTADARGAASDPQRWRLSGDLDTIVLKALKKAPDERYANARAFADDLERFLRHEPVRARPDSPFYRLRKLARRHRPALAGASVAGVLVALVALLVAARGPWSKAALAPAPRAAAPAADSARAVAVLPFVDLGAAKDEGYLADGLTEQLINEFAQLPGIRVSSRASSFFFKDKQPSIAEVARLLGVDSVVEGSVQRDAGREHIAVQLIDAASGLRLWSQRFDRDPGAVLEVPASVAASIAEALNVRLSSADLARFAVGGTHVAAAYEAFLRAEQQLDVSPDREAANRSALALFDQAIALDPGYALAHAGRARALDTLAMFHADDAGRSGLRREALAAGLHAVELAPGLGEAHASLAITRAYGLLDFRGAAPEFERALALSPGSGRVARLYAEFASSLGHHAQAIAAAQRAVSLDPQNVLSHVTLGRALHHSRNYRAALVAFRDAEVLKPKSNYVEGNIAGTLIAAGELAAARAHCESTSVALDADNRHYCLALAYHLLGQQRRAERELAELKVLAKDEAAFNYAEIYAQWGDPVTALAWLGKAAAQRAPSLQSIRVDYLLDPLRGLPEFQAIERGLDLPP
jgi:serine/threonine protein kinase/TolB-like protein